MFKGPRETRGTPHNSCSPLAKDPTSTRSLVPRALKSESTSNLSLTFKIANKAVESQRPTIWAPPSTPFWCCKSLRMPEALVQGKTSGEVLRLQEKEKPEACKRASVQSRHVGRRQSVTTSEARVQQSTPRKSHRLQAHGYHCGTHLAGKEQC